MISIKNTEDNRLAKVVRLKGLKKHSNADRLQTVDIDYQTVITGLDAKEGEAYVYFPVESKINSEFLAFTNSFRNKDLNVDSEKVGFFEDNCRVRAMKLRGEKSMGYIVPVSQVEAWANVKDLESFEGQDFDTINGKLLVEKYRVKTKTPNAKQGKEKKTSRLIDGQVRLHVDTENLRRNVHKIHPEDTVSITYKTHGTSWWVGNVLVKRKLSWLERLAKKLGVNVEEKEYDHVYGSRRVVKNKHLEDPKAKDHFYGYDLWKDIKDQVAEFIPKGYTFYGEALGYDKNGGYIQKGYDYGCKEGQMKLEVYRITHTNSDGLVTELSYPEIKEMCDRAGLIPAHLYFYGKAKDFDSTSWTFAEGVDEWRDGFISELESRYNEKLCFMCNNNVPEEGVIVRKESFFSCDSYKLKSFKFLEWETEALDRGESDIESEN
jgi:hypothetical protein